MIIVIKIIVTAGYLYIGWMVYKWWAEVNSNKQPTVEVQPATIPEPTKRATSDLDFELSMYSSEMQIAVLANYHRWLMPLEQRLMLLAPPQPPSMQKLPN